MEITPIREDPPAQRRAGKYDALADLLIADPGNWYRVTNGATSGGLAAGINNGKIRAFEPAGHFEAVSRSQEDGIGIWARYIGEQSQTVPNFEG